MGGLIAEFPRRVNATTNALNRYTVVMDVLVLQAAYDDAYARGIRPYMSLFQAAPTSDGDLFIEVRDQPGPEANRPLGVSGVYDGDVTADQWHRIAWVATLDAPTSEPRFRSYVNGQPAGTLVWDEPAAQSADDSLKRDLTDPSRPWEALGLDGRFSIATLGQVSGGNLPDFDNSVLFLFNDNADEVAVQQAVYTRKDCERCIRWAFDYTRQRNSPKKTLTLVAKTNVLTFGHDLWWRPFQDVAKEYPDVKTDYNHVDACCIWMVKNPNAYDVIVTANTFGDIITDLGGILQGGKGVAAGANLNPDKGGVSMFELMGGSAPKYTGQNVINPIAAINAMAMLLEHSGQPGVGKRIDTAVAHVTGTKMKSQAVGKMGYGTREVGDLVVAALG
jgi:hypothetical protein